MRPGQIYSIIDGSRNGVAASGIAAKYTAMEASKSSWDVARVAAREEHYFGRMFQTNVVPKDNFRFAFYTVCAQNRSVDIILLIALQFALMVLIAFFFGGLRYTLFVPAFVFLGTVLLFLRCAFDREHNRAVYGFSRDGLYLKDGNEYLRILWHNIMVRETHACYFLYYSRYAGFIFPKKELPGWAEAKLKESIPKSMILKKRLDKDEEEII